MVTLFLRQGENGKQVLLSFPATTLTEIADVAATLETLKSMSETVTIQGAASEVMNLSEYLKGIDLAAEGEVERINQLADRLEHMSGVDCDKFAGMLDANSISGTKDILRLTERLDDYIILPECGSAQSIGKYLVGCGAFPVPEKLIGYINYEAVGTEFQDAHGGAACSRGYVVRKEGLPQAVLDDLHTSKQTYEMTLPRCGYAPAHSHDDLDRSGDGFETRCRCKIAFCNDQQHLSSGAGKSLYSEGRSL